MEKEMMTIGKKIFDLRSRKGSSQGELGARLGVSRQTIARWEAGTAQPNLDDVERMCAIFDVPIDYFLKRKPEMEVVAESIEVPPIAEVVAEDSAKQLVSEPISNGTVTETKQKPWKPLVVAIVFTVLTFVLLFFSIITGQTAFSPNQGVDVVSDHNFDSGAFFASLFFAILCFIIAVVGWIRYILLKKGECYVSVTKC